MALSDDKRALRIRMRALRASIAPADRAAMSLQIEDRLMALSQTRAATCAFVYRSFGSEVSTLGLIERLVADGRDVCLPVIEEGVLAAARYRPGDPMVPSGYGALEPRDRALVEPLAVDLLVVPGLAFGFDGHRLGYGGGYYDGYLRMLPGAVPRIGVAFDQQILDDIPQGDADEPLDAIVTDLDTLRATPVRP